MTRGGFSSPVASEVDKQLRVHKPLTLATFLVQTSSISATFAIAALKRNHASSTARVEEGTQFCAPRSAPELITLQYLDRRLFVQLNGSRKVIGVLRGYDVRFLSLAYVALLYTDESQVFLNIVLDDAVEEKAGGEKVRIGQVVRPSPPSLDLVTPY